MFTSMATVRRDEPTNVSFGSDEMIRIDIAAAAGFVGVFLYEKHHVALAVTTSMGWLTNGHKGTWTHRSVLYGLRSNSTRTSL